MNRSIGIIKQKLDILLLLLRIDISILLGTVMKEAAMWMISD
jgi:hypothetical protein